LSDDFFGAHFFGETQTLSLNLKEKTIIATETQNVLVRWASTNKHTVTPEATQ